MFVRELNKMWLPKNMNESRKDWYNQTENLVFHIWVQYDIHYHKQEIEYII